MPANGVSFGGGVGNGINNVPQFNPIPLNSVGFNSRQSYLGSSGPFPTLPSALGGYSNQQQFGGAISYPYLNVYGGNNVGQPPQMLPYYGQFRPFQGGQQGYGGISAYGSAPFMPLSSRIQTNVQLGQQPGLFAPLGANTQPLFDRMDTEKQSDEQAKKSTQQ